VLGICCHIHLKQILIAANLEYNLLSACGVAIVNAFAPPAFNLPITVFDLMNLGEVPPIIG
jgi:hypothetical protein